MEPQMPIFQILDPEPVPQFYKTVLRLCLQQHEIY